MSSDNTMKSHAFRSFISSSIFKCIIKQKQPICIFLKLQLILQVKKIQMIEDEGAHSKKYKNQRNDRQYRISVQVVLQTSLDENIIKGLTQEEKIQLVIELRSIHLQWLNIRKIENLEVFTNLNVLYLQHNKIARIENLECLQNLQYLAINDNLLTSIENISMLPKLVGLNCNNNQIEDLTIKELPKSLQLVSFTQNPVALNANYKTDLIKGLPALEVLDGQNISVEEKFIIMGKFPAHLKAYAGNLRQFRSKKEVEKKLQSEKKPLYLGGEMNETEAIQQIRQKTRKFLHEHQQTFKTEINEQKQNFQQKIQISKKIRNIKQQADDEVKMKMSQVIEANQQHEEM